MCITQYVLHILQYLSWYIIIICNILIDSITHIGLYYYIIVDMTFYDYNVIDVISTKYLINYCYADYTS